MLRRFCMYALIVLALLASLAGYAAVPDPADGWVQWNNGDGHNNHWYKIFLWTDVPGNPGQVGINWFNSQAYAIGIGGDLATCTSFDENTFVFELINQEVYWIPGEGPDGAWFGPWLGGYQNTASLSYSEPAGGWEWVTAEPWDWTNWDDGEPNNRIPGEDYLHFVGRGGISDKWNDLRGDWEMKGFVVELVPEPPSILALSGGLLGILGIMRRRRG